MARQERERRLWWRRSIRTVNTVSLVLLSVIAGSANKLNEAIPTGRNHKLRKLRGERKLRRRLNEEYNMRVLLHLSLEYSNDTLATQIETRDPSNDAVEHFCDAVNEQAGGNQVQLAAQEIGVEMETRIYGSIQEPDFQCTILSSARKPDSNGEDMFGSGFFSLSVTVEQVVYIFADRILSRRDVTSMVESGFNRGNGGRVRFRSLLQDHPMFTTVRNVEVLEGALTREPSPSPTASPSLAPTSAPSYTPTNLPTQAPSQEPTVTPSSTPSYIPTSTEAPTHTSSTSPTELPPPVTPNSLKENDSMADDELDPLTIAAIAGAVLIICVAFCCVVCMWYRRRGKSTDKEDGINPPYCRSIPRRSRNNRRPGDVLQVPPGQVPVMVELDDGSLANTTLGDQTAGGFRRLPARKNRLGIDPKRVRKLDSFDENSLYTTPLPLSSEPPAESTPSDRDSHYNMSSISILPPSIMPFEEENVTFPDIDPADSDDSTSSESGAMQSSLLSQSYASFSLPSNANRVAGPVDLDTAKPVNTNSSAFELNDSLFRSNIEKGQIIDQEKAKLDSDAIYDGSDSFSPFDDNEYSLSKLRLGEKHQGGDSSFRSLDDSAVPSAASSASALTKKVENMVILGFRSPPEEKSHDSPRDEEEKREIDYESRDDSSVHETRRPPLSLDLLADHQHLERSDSPTSWSSWKVSQDGTGAPRARAIKYASARNVEDESKRPDAKEDFFAAVGIKPFLPIQNQQAKDSLPEEKDLKVEEIKKSDSMQSDGKHMLVTPASSGLSSAHEDGTGILGVRPRREAPALDAGSVVSSNSGLSNPWLFDAIEQTLGPKSPTADMESLGGRSDRSGKSHRSTRSQKSANRSVKSIRSHLSYNAPSRKHKGRASDNIQSAVASVASYAGSSLDKKSAETTLTPRTLGHDLKRLESQLAALQTETDQVTASSITLSSIGARTRSTRSSRLTHTGAKFTRKKRRVIVEVPPGKLGVILANRHDGKGTVISEVKPDSALKGMLNPGDKLVAIDGEDVAGLTVTEITTIMTRKHDMERLLTVITSTHQETKSVGTL